MPKKIQYCSNLLANGECQDTHCGRNHNVPTCNICGIYFASVPLSTSHFKSRKHQMRARGEMGNAISHCPACSKNVLGSMNWTQHVQGIGHADACRRQGIDIDIDPDSDDVPRHRLCPTCNIHVKSSLWNRHVSSAQHLAKARYTTYRAAIEESERDKSGVALEGEADFGIISPEEVGRKSRKIVIRNASPQSDVKIVEIRLGSCNIAGNPSPFSFSATVSAGSTVKYGRPADITVHFSSTYISRYFDRLEVVFEDVQLSKRFTISRSLLAIVGSATDHQALQPRVPYTPRKRTARQPEVAIEEGVKPDSLKVIPYVVKLPQAAVPPNLKNAMEHGSIANMQLMLQSCYLPPSFNSNTYARHFKHLIWIEELQMEHDLAIYDIDDASLDQHGRFHFLNVPGLAEKRPSVLVGDSILVQRHGAAHGHWFEGGVHIVRREEVGLRFTRSFKSVTGKVYNIRFKLNRYPLRRQHQALDTVFAEDRVLFPTNVHVTTDDIVLPQQSGLNLFNPLIKTNLPQYQAVTSIVNLPVGSQPFVIFGPPGTGKTITAVEAIRQVLRTNPLARIIACAPSNSAADLIAQRLKVGLSKDELFRFYAPSRHKEQVPLDLRDYTYAKSMEQTSGIVNGVDYRGVGRSEGHFSVPPLARMKNFRVVVTTCVSGSIFYGMGIPRGHYSHIFIDEAGQATETEVMIPIKTMADRKTNIILSGDPKQLGPIIRSRVAANLGLEMSYLERLMNRPIYDERQGHGISVVKLVKNFRSHAAILKFPNEHFYKTDLEPHADSKVVNAYLGSNHLNKKFPIVFYAVAGKDDREASSPSFFNIDEVTQVKKVIQELKEDRKVRTTDKDIGVITPYHAQCLKIRNSLRAFADEVKVGSVEEFQGQERKVVIMSTVRSSKEFVGYDLKHTLGFVANPRRFNVAVTRAQALLIVVGDPAVLSLDPLWRAFLNYIHVNGGWRGAPISWDPQAEVRAEGGYDMEVREGAVAEMNEFTRRMQEMTLGNVERMNGEEDEVDVNVDREWRDLE